jgi:MFS transporter, FHS family, Na+ dependent glucose transporter 1
MSSSLPSVTNAQKSFLKSYRISTTIGYFLAFIALGLAASILGPTLPGLAQHTATSLASISILFSARSLGYLVGASQGGRLYDRLPGHTLLAMMICLIALNLALAPLISMLWLLIAIIFLLGTAEGNLDVGCNTLIVWVHGDKVSPFMNSLHFFFGLGAFVSPIILARLLENQNDISLAYWILALACLPALIWIVRNPSPQHPAIADENHVPKSDLSLAFLISVFFFFYVGAEVAFAGWIFSYITAIRIGTAAMAAYLTSGFWGTYTLGRLISIPLATRVRPLPILVIDMAGCLASIGLILLFKTSALAIWIGTLGVGLSMASIFPTTLTLAGSRMTISGKVTGWFFIGSSLGGMTLPWLIGQLFQGIGPWTTMVALMIDLIIMVIVFSFLFFYSHRTRARI